MSDDKRLIEDYLPIVVISAEASREKSVRKGHISTLHLWWARRPLVACRAAVYGALVPASQFVPNGGPDAQKKSLGRANAAKFIERLCKYPGSAPIIKEAQEHILTAHAERLSRETDKPVTVADIVDGRAPRPKVLDMFAGGGAIPLEALRLGCEAYALDLNPVAHIIQLCTLVYPQRYGKPDLTAKGFGEDGTWAGLAAELQHWGNWVLEKARAEIGDLYPPIPDPQASADDFGNESEELMGFAKDPQKKLRMNRGFLTPVAYLWTRTVQCKNPACGATVPMVKQTWLCKKKDRLVAMRAVALKGAKRVRFEIVQGKKNGLGFDPDAFSKRGNAECPFCGTVADTEYIKQQGMAGRLSQQAMAIACAGRPASGKIYVSPDDAPAAIPSDEAISQRLRALCQRTGLTVPDEPMPVQGTLGFRLQAYGVRTWGELFTPRQMLCVLTFVAAVREAEREMQRLGLESERAKAVTTLLAAMVDRLASFSSSQCIWLCVDGERTANTFGRHALPMVWDFSEVAPFNDENAGWPTALERVVPAVQSALAGGEAVVQRGSATSLPWPDNTFDAVITDPPYYDNVPYADLSDFFYIFLKRTIGHLFPEHFAGTGSPKKTEVVAEPMRYGGSKEKAKNAYEELMREVFKEAYRTLKPGGEMLVVYAHKTTLGWSTLVDALRQASFTVNEAWPLDTEKPGRLRAQDSAALASSIFLVARKRDGSRTANYEEHVRPELEEIVHERVDTLWDMGISGADLVIASVGAGLRAFTRFASVEYANGEEVPAERFLTEVETVVLETILSRLSKEVGGKGGQYSLASLDTESRFYVLWRYTYGAAELDAGEAIIFANGTHVELDGQHGLTGSNDALVEKKKSKYRLRDYVERGENDKLGLLAENGQAAPLIDTLHRMLWLMEKRPAELATFLTEARPNREQLRLVAQALAGPALKGGELGDISPTAELSALAKLTTNWQSVVEEGVLTPSEKQERKTGQRQLI